VVHRRRELTRRVGASALPTSESLASDNEAPPRTVATARVAPIPARSTNREARRRPEDEPADRRSALLSPKTVETHMRNIFRKLDVSSRVEVARAVEHADRAESAPSQ
jgi:Bacterial regulatory proteins, luxR family